MDSPSKPGRGAVRRQPRLLVMALAGLALGAGSGIAWGRPLPAADDSWIRVDTAHLILFSNSSRNHTLQVGRRLELFRLALSRLEPGLTVNSPLPTAIYVFKHEASFRPYKKWFGDSVDDLSGYFVADSLGNYVGLNATPQGNAFMPVYHEYVHYFINNNFPNVPLWFNEGIAECYSTFRTFGSEVEVGRPIEAYVDMLKQQGLMPLERLIAVRTSSAEYNERDRKGLFYAQSWGLVHYLLWGKPGWASHLEEKLARLNEGSDLPALLGLPDYAAVERALRPTLERGRFGYTRVDAGNLAVDENARVRPLTHAESVYHLGNLLAHLGPERSPAAERHFREALRLDPSLAAAWTGLGYLRDLHGRHEEAASLYEKALSHDRSDPLAHFLYATSIMDRHHSERRRLRRTPGGATPEHLVQARKLFTESLRLRPDLTEAYAGLGATYAFEESGFDEGIAALEKARSLLPSRMDIVFNLLGLYARRGDRLAAEALVEVLDRQGDPALLADAHESLLQGDLITASRLMKKDRLDEALELLRQVRSRTRDAGLRADLDKQIGEIERVQKTNEMIDEYNRAVTLVNRREYSKAAPILRRVIEGAEDENLRRSARTLLADIERALGDTRPRN